MAHAESPVKNAEDARKKLMQASHILAHHNILDGFGHISVRNPETPGTFFLTGQAAALIRSPDIFNEYNITDGKPVKDGVFVSPYSEHYIHAAILAKFPDVNSVVHSHAPDVLPFGSTATSDGSSGLKPCVHTTAFLGETVPSWDIGRAYTTEEQQHRHLLVNNYSLGSSLAAAAENPSGQYPYHKVVLQRGHGFIALGDAIEESVYNAIYAVENARVQSQAEQRAKGAASVQFLSSGEIRSAAPMDRDCIVKVWPLWLEEVKKNPLFH